MDELISETKPQKPIATYSKSKNFSQEIKPDLKPCDFQLEKDFKHSNSELKVEESVDQNLREKECNLEQTPLTTKDAVEYLINGILKEKVCRYCLNTSSELTNLDELITIATSGTLFSVAIKQMIASFHPVKIADDPNFPNKICQSCLDRTISSYLFAQQCNQSEQALQDCFKDMYEKAQKLDPLERTKRRGRYKLKPNYNILHTEHKYVVNYCKPTIHINSTVVQLPNEPKINDFECLKCSQVLPDSISLLNHVKTHPKSQWFNCRLCGKSFPKLFHLKKHFRQYHNTTKNNNDEKSFKCKDCGILLENYQQFYQHKEKHKFKTVMKHLVTCKMDKLCTICLEKGSHMIGIEENVNLHGGFLELTGDKSVLTMAAATLPEMNILTNHTGTKICQKCYSKILSSYLFVTQTYIARNKLDSCITYMINSLSNIETQKNLCIEISQNFIMPAVDINIVIPKTDNNIKIEVLEDEFRIDSDEDTAEFQEKDTVEVKSGKTLELKSEDTVELKYEETIELNVKENVKLTKDKSVKINSKTLNGYQKDVSEFLTFKKKKPIKIRYTCPLCNKHFISGYFLKRHVLKHGNKNVFCHKCDLKFTSKFVLFEHNKIVHSKKDIKEHWACNTCDRTFTVRPKFLAHRKQHLHRNCELCDKYFKSQYHYNIHMQRHIQKLRYIKEKSTQTCSFCEKECSNNNDLSLHVNKVHLQIKSYICDMCDRQFYTELNLKCHKKLHSMYSREKCSFCSKVLKSRAKFIVHLRKHIGVKPFTCEICFEAFFSEKKFQKHLRIHLGNFRIIV